MTSLPRYQVIGLVAIGFVALAFHATLFVLVAHRLSLPLVGVLVVGAVGVKAGWRHRRRLRLKH